MDWILFLEDAAQRTRDQAGNINPCADPGDVVKQAILARAKEWQACAAEMLRLRTFIAKIAGQKTIGELSEAGEDCEGDFEGAYQASQQQPPS